MSYKKIRDKNQTRGDLHEEESEYQRIYGVKKPGCFAPVTYKNLAHATGTGDGNQNDFIQGCHISETSELGGGQ